jgi:hypothetical protein
MDQSRVGTFTQVAELPYMSKRFALKRYLGLTEEEMAQNATLWAEENNVAQKKQSKTTQMRTAGVSQADVSADLDNLEEPTAEPGTEQPGQQTTTPGAPTPPGQTPGGGTQV